MTIRVVLVDDENCCGWRFRMVLDGHADLEVVGEAANGREAVAAARDPAPDVVVMDVRMPEHGRRRGHRADHRHATAVRVMS